MSLNKYMHPRNIYKTPPDFGELAKVYPEFSKVAKTDITGKITIDFKDPNSLRILTRSLLKSDFNLDVTIPEDRLVPTLPLRLNYILWIEDLLISINKVDHVTGIDIGTGACAIYPLLGAVKNKWHMIGTEQDGESLIQAQENVNKNRLVELIEIKKNPTNTIIEHLLAEGNSTKYNFCMCNPPFYSSVQELCESRSPARPPPKNGFTGSPQELITEGGELKFCRKLITESKKFKDKVFLYTTMVGHKYNLAELIQDLKADGIKHTHTEFCQGRVTRWGLAWTFMDFDIFKLVSPRSKPRKKNPPLVYILPKISNTIFNLESAFTKLKSIFKDLDISHNIIEKRGNCICMDVISRKNTWSNQRRKRRLLKKIETEQSKKSKINDTQGESISNNSLNGSSCDTNAETDIPSCSMSNEQGINEQTENITNNVQDPKIVVHSLLKIFKKETDILMEVEFLDGDAGKEGLHQIVQYIKNNWK